MECEGPSEMWDVGTTHNHPSESDNSLFQQVHDNATGISVRYDMDKLYQCWIILLIKVEFDRFLGPLDLLPWRVVGRSVGRSVRLSTSATRQPIFGLFSKLVGIFLG